MIMEFIESPIIYITSSQLLASMEQSLQNNPHNKHRKRGRRIQKTPKRPKNHSLHSSGNGYTHKKVRFMEQKQSLNSMSSIFQRGSQWLYSLSSWLPESQRSTLETLTQLQSQLPSLTSIDHLFQLASSEILEENINLIHLFRYSNIFNLLSHPHGRTIILKNQQAEVLGVCLGQEGTESRLSCGMLLSQSQSELVEKRSKFMEKLKGNESKYANSLGRMSQISKELAFTYRCYLQVRNEVLSKVESLTRKEVSVFPFEKRNRSRYAELLIIKNLNHTFGSLDLDPYNYFKMRQYLETDRVHEFQNISSFQDLQIFIQKRKPKRGRRIGLSTACSICLSDYYELNNPLKTCSSCGLRAHKLCFCFDHSRCGYCVYQKLERPLKQEISWCFICRQPGLMVMKLTQSHYAHGFCLMVHGLWTTTSNSPFLHANDSPSTGEVVSCKEFPCKCNQNIGAIEFLNPFQNKVLEAKTLNLVKTGQRTHLTLNHNGIEEEKEEIVEKDIEELDNLIQKRYQEDLSEFEMEHNPSMTNQGCHRCGVAFCKDYYLTCHLCGHRYHALCSYLAGFKLQLQEGDFRRKSEFGVKVNCCDSQCPRIGWNRRFKLNYNRCVFNLHADELEHVPGLWEQ